MIDLSFSSMSAGQSVATALAFVLHEPLLAEQVVGSLLSLVTGGTGFRLCVFDIRDESMTTPTSGG